MSSVTKESGWLRLKISGGPGPRGYTHGFQLCSHIEKAIVAVSFSTKNSFGIPYKRIAELFFDIYGGRVNDSFPDLMEEMKGIHDGMKAKNMNTPVSLEELFLWNMWYTIGYAMGHMHEEVIKSPELSQKYSDLFPGGRSIGSAGEGGASDKCSAFIAVGDWTEDGKIVCAHNTFDNFIDSQWANLLLHVVPSKGHEFLMQTCPGQVASGTDYYVTSGGFIVTETTIGGFNAFKLGDPIFCRIRKAVQHAASLDDFVEILSKENGGDYANSWLIGDVKNNEIMRIELGLDYVNVERKKNGYFIGFNAPYDDRIRNLECQNTGFYDVRRHQGARRVRLEQLMKEHKGKITIKIGQEILADHYDVYLNKINMCSRTCCSHYDLDQRQFMSQADRPLPYQPRGAIDGIVTDSTLASKLGFTARWGSSCGTPFFAKEFCDRNIQWADQLPYLIDRPEEPWLTATGKKRDRLTRKHRRNKNARKTKRNERFAVSKQVKA
jgi:hypothetical protein